MWDVGRVDSVQCVCNARHSHRDSRGGRRVACRWRVALLTLVCRSRRACARPRMRVVACKTSALLRTATAATTAGLADARARCVTHRCARLPAHTCCCLRARPIFTASSQLSVVHACAGVLRGPRAVFRAMAMLDAAVHVLCAGRLGVREAATLFSLNILIRTTATARNRKYPYSGDVWGGRSTHLPSWHHGDAPGRERTRAAAHIHGDPYGSQAQSGRARL